MQKIFFLAIFPVFLFCLCMPQLSYSKQDQLDQARILDGLAYTLRNQGRYLEAIEPSQKALAIVEKVFGPDHPEVAMGLNSLAELYRELGEYNKAKPLYERAIAIFGLHNPRVASTLNNLASLYKNTGNYEKAEALYTSALKITQKVYGPAHPLVAIVLNNLAALYHASGNYEKAETLFKRSLDIREKALGQDHVDVASSLNNLAALYKDLGDYRKALLLNKRSLSILEKNFEEERLEFAVILTNIAYFYKFIGDYAKAESIYTRVLSNFEKKIGMEHPLVASVLNDLAALYRDSGNYEKAETLFKRSLDIQEKVLGPDHVDVAVTLNSMATLYKDLGDYEKAEAIYKRALDINEKRLGPDHPVVEVNMNNLGKLYAAMDNFKKAHYFFKNAQKIEDNLIDHVMGFTSEERMLKFLSTRKTDLYLFLSLVSQHLADQLPSVRDAFDVWLKRKGMILEAQKRFQNAFIHQDNLETKNTFQNLSTVRSELSALVFAGPGSEGIEAHQKKISDLTAKKEDLEARLNKLSKSFSLAQRTEKADCDKISKALPKNSALIEFSKAMMFNFKSKRTEKKWNPGHYLAFVLHANQGNNVRLLDLGNAEDIDRAVAEFKKEISEKEIKNNQKQIKSCRSIYDKVFEPLRNELGDIKEIFISPDGNLSLIPFEVLQRPDGKYLIEFYTFNYLAAARDLLLFGQIEEIGDKVLLMGDPDFDLKENEKSAEIRKLSLKEVRNDKPIKRSSDMQRFHFTRLPGTAEEVRSIQNLFGQEKVILYTEKRALEDILRQMETPSILHLATHGFFLSDLMFEDPENQSLERGIKISSVVPKKIDKKIGIENPLLRSGIALAGANIALESNETENSDGIVTAEKILGLNLRGTEMVVLSACGTGLGEVETGEGVFGLRRAFTRAGAKSLVMSMWDVPDMETKELMVEFYKVLLSGKVNRCKALRKAVLKEMEIVQERYGNKNPFYWGAFVFMGEP